MIAYNVHGVLVSVKHTIATEMDTITYHYLPVFHRLVTGVWYSKAAVAKEVKRSNEALNRNL